MAIACNTENIFLQEWDTPYGIPPFDKIKVSDYMPAIKAGIEQHNAEIQAIIDNAEAQRSPTCFSTSASPTTARR